MTTAARMQDNEVVSVDLGTTVRRVVAHHDEEHAYTEELVRDLSEASAQTGSVEASAQSHFLRAEVAISQNELCRALVEIEKGLRLAPHDLSFQLREKPQIFVVAGALNRLAKLNPGHPEVGRAYRKLLQFGEIGFETHLFVVQHHLLSDDLAAAKDQAERLFRAAPNMPGLRALMSQIAERSGDRTLELLAADGAHATAFRERPASLSPLEAFSLLPILRTTYAHLGEDMFDAVLETVALVLPKDGSFHPRLVEFHYLRALALDKLHRVLEAFELFRQVKEARPENPTFARSLRVQTDRIYAKAQSLHIVNPLDPELEPLARMMKEHSVLPFWLGESLSLMEIARGERAFAKARSLATLALSPNDSDYVKTALKVAEALGDELWLRELQNRMARLRVQRPWDFELFF